MKPKLPKEFYTVSKIEGMTDNMIAEYRKLVRHEIYVEQKEQRLRAFSYGNLSDVEYLCPTAESFFQQAPIRNEALSDALELLRIANESWYNAVMDYYILYDGISFSELASKYGVSKAEAYRRVMRGLRFLKDKMR